MKIRIDKIPISSDLAAFKEELVGLELFVNPTDQSNQNYFAVRSAVLVTAMEIKKKSSLVEYFQGFIPLSLFYFHRKWCTIL